MENDSEFKKKRFVECEWNGQGKYPGADKISRSKEEDGLTKKQVNIIDKHYSYLEKAINGDLNALNYFDDLGADYSDVIDSVIFGVNFKPELASKFLCDAVKLKKEIVELSKEAKKDGEVTKDDSATNASSGNYAKNASSGNYAKNASSGNSATNASSGDSATNASSGDSAKNASSGNYATNASSGNSATNEGTGKQSICVAGGLESRAKVGAEGAIALTWYDGKRPRIIVGYAGEDGIKADTWYQVKNGKLVEVK